MNFAVLVFPGSNCDIDCYKAVEDTIGQSVDYVWHTATILSEYDAILCRADSPTGITCAAERLRNLRP